MVLSKRSLGLAGVIREGWITRSSPPPALSRRLSLDVLPDSLSPPAPHHPRSFRPCAKSIPTSRGTCVSQTTTGTYGALVPEILHNPTAV